MQSHFGGLWQRNIFENLAFYATARQKKQYAATFTAPHGKTAAIIAAGPSLDKAIVTLQKERANYYIIATDTAYPALMAQNIRADACISVDAQMISHAHFFSASPETLFIFDLSANPAAVRFAVKKGAPIMYAETGHPLSCLAAVSTQGACFPHIETGSGTVTSAAAAFAVQAGFETLAFFGNDFAYLNGKPYTKGCYLDALYNTKSIHTMSAEQQFTALMFRTELIPTEHGVTTPILNAYRTANELFLHKHGYKATGENIYRCAHTQTGISCAPFDYRTFCKNVRDCLKNDTRILLPYIAWLRQKQPKSTYKGILSLAQSRTLVYTYEDEN